MFYSCHLSHPSGSAQNSESFESGVSPSWRIGPEELDEWLRRETKAT